MNTSNPSRIEAAAQTAATRTSWLNSLQGRFIAASLLCLPLFIGVSGLLLERAYKDSLMSAEQEQLTSQLYILLGAADVQAGELWLPEQLHEPRYNTLDSGLYANVTSPAPHQDDTFTTWQRHWQSTSADMLTDPLPYNAIAFRTNQRLMESIGNYFRLTYDLSWQTEDNRLLPFRFQIYHSRDTFQQQMKKFRQQLWYGLSFLAMGLLTIQVLIMRWGLSPLKRLVKELKRLTGQPNPQLRGQYPDEITPVTDSLNEVLLNEQQQRERYRNTLGDLAHSLKTPLAIVQGELQQPAANTNLIEEQLERMSTIIRHQLQRAVLQTNQQRHNRQPIKPVVQRLCNAMEKVYRDKSLQFQLHIADDLSYPIESQDLFELLGNLVENACKYGKDQVSIRALETRQELMIVVADNGPGVPAKDPQTILQRGARLDTAKPGQGIGLAVTTDIVSAYGGSIQAGNSKELGGAEFSVHLPLTSGGHSGNKRK